MNQKPVEERIAELKRIAERAFKARFSGIKLVRIDVKPGYDLDGDSVVDVTFVCDGDYSEFNGKRIQKVNSEIITNAWRYAENDLGLGFPLIHYFDKDDFEDSDAAAA